MRFEKIERDFDGAGAEDVLGAPPATFGILACCESLKERATVPLAGVLHSLAIVEAYGPS
jgi:hypothetical protein